MANIGTPTRVAVLLITLVVALVLLLANTVEATNGAADDPATAVVVTHRVVGGDTLWGIAEHYGDGEDDVRRTVYEIQQRNGLRGSLIVPGQLLEIPVPG